MGLFHRNFKYLRTRIFNETVAEFIEASRIVPGTLDTAAVEDESADRS